MKKNFLSFLSICLVFIYSCAKDQNPSAVGTYVDTYVYLSNPSNVNLAAVGGWAYVQGGGRGIILYRLSNEDFIAYERNCTYRPTDSCATVNVSSNYMNDNCCASQFNLYDGTVLKGPAQSPLRRYNTSFSNNVVHITSY